MKILVTGGAGYIGGFMAARLLDEKHEVVIVDSLKRGHKESLDPRGIFVQGDLTDASFLQSLFTEHQFEFVIHFAGYISMAESMKEPGLYFFNNTFATVTLLEQMRLSGVKNIIFSSTAGVYGNPVILPIPEDHGKNPENPYGESKLLVERILSWYQKIHGINYTVLRYFNAAGAALDGSRGEAHNPESHIIPCVIHALLEKKPFTLFGNDYQTKDGTCVRDYIHVLDLVEAHLLAMQKLTDTHGGFSYNVGTGTGFSNKEVVDMVKQVSRLPLEVIFAQRRPGDADSLIADSTNITKELHFTPQFSDLKTIVTSAWKWHTKETSL